MDEAVRRAAARFKLPTRDEVEGLKSRLEAISVRLEELARERNKTG